MEPPFKRTMQSHVNDESNDTLYKAAANGEFTKVCALLYKDGHPNGQPNPEIKPNMFHTINNQTPLFVAAMNNKFQCVELLVNFPGTNVNLSRMTYEKETPLYVTAEKGYAASMRVLLRSAAIDVNKAITGGFFPLWIAAANGHVECVKLLLQHHLITIEQVASDNTSALFAAAAYGHAACVQLFIHPFNSELSQPDAFQTDATTDYRRLISLYKRKQRVHKYLNLISNTGDTPLSIAVKKGFYDVVQVLLAAQGYSKRYVSDLAEGCKQEEIRLLLEKLQVA